MSEEEERKKKEEKEKAIYWLLGQKQVKRRFNAHAYNDAQERYKAEYETEELQELEGRIKNAERIAKIEIKKIRKERDELRRIKKESK